MKLYVSFEFLNPNQPLVVGVSGGADSLCLLGMLHEAGFNLIVAHLNHQLRLEAVKEAEHVMKIAGTMGIPYVGDAMDVGVFATENGFSIEEAARKCRYRFLFGVARENKAQAVAVAHTADDQIETILMHLVRGAGLSGLKGMPPLTRLLEFDFEDSARSPYSSFVAERHGGILPPKQTGFCPRCLKHGPELFSQQTPPQFDPGA